MTDRDGIGGNSPPAHEAFSLDIEDLYASAKDFIDGQPIENEGQAEAVAAILDHARKTWKAGDEQRKTEKRPHDEAAQAVQDTWNPLLARAKKVETVAKAAAGAWLVKKDAEQRAIAQAARDEADRLARAADDANLTARPDALEDQEALDTVRKAAADAAKIAGKADKAKANVASGGRAIGLRTYYRAEVTDYAAFGRWAWVHRRAEYETFLSDLAARECQHGPVTIPGIITHTERRAA